MKKLNKKGFTLVELLAVIVILAVIMVITIPTVLGSMNDAKKSAFNSAVSAAQKYFDDQKELCEFGDPIAKYNESIFVRSKDGKCYLNYVETGSDDDAKKASIAANLFTIISAADYGDQMTVTFDITEVDLGNKVDGVAVNEKVYIPVIKTAEGKGEFKDLKWPE